MIIKNFNLKDNCNKNIRAYLLHGENIGLIENTIDNQLKPFLPKKIFNYDENEILIDVNKFKETLFNKSFFDDEKLIIINRSSDKIIEIVDEFLNRNIFDTILILKSSNLTKKSKLRNYFEKQINTVSSAFYEDNFKSLVYFAQNFLRDRNIQISLEILNLIIERSKGDRISLKNELEKISSFSKNKHSINLNQIKKLTNLAQDYDLTELVDGFLIRNKKKIIKILNENNFNDGDDIKVLRILIQKLKRLKILKTNFAKNNNLDKVLTSYKPPIFWKDKEIIKQQLKILTLGNIKYLIIKINSLELNIKKNSAFSKNWLNNFILERF